MKMDKVAGSGNDEFYTPKYAINPIVDVLKSNGYRRIWCPFDSKESLFVKTLSENGFDVINTHISNGEDFFSTNIECDAIISNPPYSKKNEVFERLFSLKTPFAMLVGFVGLFESQFRFDLFQKNDFEVMLFNRRVSYFRDLSDDNPALNPPFSSAYITHNMLPSKIIFRTINKKDIK